MRSEMFYKGISDNIAILSVFAPFEGMLVIIKKNYTITNGNILDGVLKPHIYLKEVTPKKSLPHLTNKQSNSNHTASNCDCKSLHSVIPINTSKKHISIEPNDGLFTYSFDQLKLERKNLSTPLRFANQNECCILSCYEILNQTAYYEASHSDNHFYTYQLNENVITKVKINSSDD
jgi:hypothetical protein